MDEWGNLTTPDTAPKKEDAWASKSDWGDKYTKSDAWGESESSGGSRSKNDDSWGDSKSFGGNLSKNDDVWGQPKSFGSNRSKSDAWGESKSFRGNRSKKDDACGEPKGFRGNRSKNDDAWGEIKNFRGNRSKNDDAWGSNNDEDGQARKRIRKDEDKQDKEDRPAPYKPDAVDLEEEAQMQAETGANFEHYLTQKVTCLPSDAIKPIETFSDAISSQLLLDNIEKSHYTAMTPIQKWAIPTILAGYDIIGCAQTGSGKTAAFLLPILQTILRMEKIDMPDPNSDCQNPYCLVISPTRELAKQIYVASQILSKDSIVKTQVIYGQIATAHLKAQLCRGCHVLVATPGKLKDFLERGWIGFKNIKYVILDEGDRLVDDGFSSDIELFFSHETMPPKECRQTLFFSATFKQETQLSAKRYLKDDFIFLTVGRIGAANENIKQEFLQIPRHEKKRELKKLLANIPEDEKTIIFTQTKQAADLLAGFFNGLNLSSTSIHGDRHQSQREQAIRAFKKGEKRFLISSPVGNRGLDLPKVALVINYDLPNNVDEYVHRIGRTGRAGHTGRAISFCDVDRDAELLPQLIKILEEVRQEVPDWMRGVSTPPEEEAENQADFPAVTSADDEWN